MTRSECDGVIGELDALLAGEIVGERRAALAEHLGSCEGCGRAYEELSATVALLRLAGRAEEAPAGFAEVLRRRIEAAGRPEPVGWLERLRGARWWKPVAWSAVGALVATAAVVTVWAWQDAEEAPPPTGVAAGPVAPTFRVPAARLAIVKIEFVAEMAIEEVEFAVALPEGLRFVSRGEELPDREFRWRAPLDKGSNTIPVAVRGERAGTYLVLEVTEG